MSAFTFTILKCRYYDYLADHPHDGYFTTTALKSFLATAIGEHPGLKSITFACDNGMVSALLLWTLSRLSIDCNIEIDIMPLAAYHAYSLCDAHGGIFKPALQRLACADQELDLYDLQATIEDTCARTTVTVLEITRATKDALDSDWFPAGGKPRAIQGVRSAGHVVMRRGLGEMEWRYLVGLPVDVKKELGRNFIQVPTGAVPTWFYHNANPPREGERRCRPCMLWRQQLALLGHDHRCLFLRRGQRRPAPRPARARARAPAPAAPPLCDDAASGPSGGGQKLAVAWSGGGGC